MSEKNWNPNLATEKHRECGKCGKAFTTRHNAQRYCENCAKPKYGERSIPGDGDSVVTKVCKDCGKEYTTKAYAQKFCFECMPKRKAARDKAAKEKKKTGYNQAGESNNNWKGGIGVYTDLAFNQYKMLRACNRCKSERNILVHHKDRDRHNNQESNLEVLCKSCHQKEHDAGINLHPNSPVFKKLN